MPMPLPTRADTAKRFHAKVDRSGGPDTCWPWTASGRPTGYGTFWLGYERRYVSAHVAAYIFAVGPVPEGHDVDHQCHDPQQCRLVNDCPHRRCCNPAHLKAMTRAENNARSGGMSAVNAAKERCPAGHLYSLENTYRAPSSPEARHCRKCMANRLGELRNKSRTA
jgi:hypothetical protein